MTYNYKIGDITPGGDKIEHIYGQKGDIIVFDNTEEQLRWSVECKKEIYLKTTNKYNYLSDKIPSTLPDEIKKRVQSGLAMATFNSFVSKKPEEVVPCFKKIESRINSLLSPNQAKLWLILFCLSSSIILAFSLYIIFIFFFNSQSTWILCSMTGLLGSLLSLMQRNSEVTISLEDGKYYIFMQAVFISILGMLSGFSLYLIANSDLAFSFAKDNTFNLLVLSLIAGFSERFVPDLFQKTVQKT